MKYPYPKGKCQECPHFEPKCNIKFPHSDCKICDTCPRCEGIGFLYKEWKDNDVVFCPCPKGQETKLGLIKWVEEQEEFNKIK